MSPNEMQMAEKMVADLNFSKLETGTDFLESKKEVLTLQSLHPHPWWVIHPHDYYRRLWDGVAIFLIIYNAFYIPYNLAFGATTSDTPPFDRAVDCFFGLDIILNFFTGYQQSASTGGAVIMTPTKIAKNYVSSWFFVDFVSTFPFDLVFSQVYAQATNLIKLLKLSRLLRLLRIFRMVRIINRLEFALLIRAAAGTLGKYMMVVIIFSHWFACLFFMVGPGAFMGGGGYTEDEICYWRPAAESRFCATAAEDDLQYEQYVAALYWSIMTLTSVGYGDISAANTRQR